MLLVFLLRRSQTLISDYIILSLFLTKQVSDNQWVFLSERDPSVSKMVLYILNSIFYLKHVNIVSSDKRQCHTGYTYIIYG